MVAEWLAGFGVRTAKRKNEFSGWGTHLLGSMRTSGSHPIILPMSDANKKGQAVKRIEELRGGDSAARAPVLRDGRAGDQRCGV